MYLKTFRSNSVALATYMCLTYPWTVISLPFFFFPCEQAKRANHVCICLIWEKNGDEDATFTVGTCNVLLYSCLSALLGSCCVAMLLNLWIWVGIETTGM